jgi:hypothetical protein
MNRQRPQGRFFRLCQGMVKVPRSKLDGLTSSPACDPSSEPPRRRSDSNTSQFLADAGDTSERVVPADATHALSRGEEDRFVRRKADQTAGASLQTPATVMPGVFLPRPLPTSPAVLCARVQRQSSDCPRR